MQQLYLAPMILAGALCAGAALAPAGQGFAPRAAAPQLRVVAPQGLAAADLAAAEALPEIVRAEPEGALSAGLAPAMRLWLDGASPEQAAQALEALLPSRRRAAQTAREKLLREQLWEEQQLASLWLEPLSHQLEDTGAALGDSQHALAEGAAALAALRRELEQAASALAERAAALKAAGGQIEEQRSALSTARQEWRTAKEQYTAALADAGLREEQLPEALARAEAAIAEVENGLRELSAGLVQVDEAIARAQLAEDQLGFLPAWLRKWLLQWSGGGATVEQLKAYRAELMRQQTEWQTRLEALEAQRRGLEQLDTARQQLADGQQALTAGEAALREAEEQYLTGEAALNAAREAYRAAETQYKQKRAEFSEGQLALQQALETYQSGAADHAAQLRAGADRRRALEARLDAGPAVWTQAVWHILPFPAEEGAAAPHPVLWGLAALGAAAGLGTAVMIKGGGRAMEHTAARNARPASGRVLLEARGLTRQYGSGSGATLALNNADLKIYQGELLVILGSSGSGKSTLLNLIGGMDRPTAGHILVEGEDICRFNDRRLTAYRRSVIGFVFQSFNLIQDLTAEENVALTADRGAGSAGVRQALELVGLGAKGHKYPSQLSGGEQQRVAIARALAKSSAFLLCDEPTGALDYETGKQVLIRLEALCREWGKTVVIVTHTKEIARMADRVVRVRSGKILQEIVQKSPLRAEQIEW